MKKLILAALLVVPAAVAHNDCEITVENVVTCLTTRVANGEAVEAAKTSIVEEINASVAHGKISAEFAAEVLEAVNAFNA